MREVERAVACSVVGWLVRNWKRQSVVPNWDAKANYREEEEIRGRTKCCCVISYCLVKYSWSFVLLVSVNGE